MSSYEQKENSLPERALLKLVEAYGGFFDVQLLSVKLRKTENEILEDIKNNKFFALELNEQILVPSFQFVSFKPLPYLSDILDNMNGVDSWLKIVFFLTQIDKLKDYPAHILRKEPTKADIDVVLQSARLYIDIV